MERPLLLILAALMTGIGAATYTGLLLPNWLSLPAALLLTFGLVAKRKPYLVIGMALLALLWGGRTTIPYISPKLPSDHISRKIAPNPVTVVGILCNRPQAKGRTTRLFIDTESVNGVPSTGRILITTTEGFVPVMTGDRVSLVTRLREARNLGIPGEYDFRRLLAFQGIFVTGHLSDPAGMILLKQRVKYPCQRWIDEIAVRLCRYIDRSTNSAESGVLKALLVGERGSVGPELEELYARAGVNHILSISGFHVGILGFVIYQLLTFIAGRSERLLHYNIRWLLLLATLPFITFYLLLSGAAPATVRSALMIAACFLALLLERETDALNTLALAAFAILVISSGALFDVSFQLSFLALWGILVVSPLLLSCYRGERNGLGYRLVQFGAVSAAAISATLLPVAYNFHRVSVLGMLSNFVVVPLLGYGAVVAGFSALLFSAFAPLVANPLIVLAALLVSWSNLAMRWIDLIPQIPRFTPSIYAVVGSIMFLLVLTVSASGKRRLILSLLIVILSCSMAFSEKMRDRGRLKLLFFSVGHGDSTFISFPDGSNMLIDGGGALRENGFDVGERLIAPALWSLGIDRIDRMVLTHPHPDHVKGLLFIADNFKVGEFWETGYQYDYPSYRRLKDLLRSRQVATRIINNRIPPFIAGGVVIEPLAPPESTGLGFANDLEANEESMVFRVSIGRFSALFTGDAGFASEVQLLAKARTLQSTVLKVAHHGSRYSSSTPFLKAVAPQLAIISVGYQNNFHLPADDTVVDLEKVGARIHRTDRKGSLELSVDPATGRMETKEYPPSSIDTE
ncbi:ComE operon protein 3 [Geobacter sp. OR-1]|uniref:DNA internalization-related competence protein ComEC/Rec2 n=1 Tax=Geobacter sp. OR-1 TaxID=1266765 RepID=UPI000541E183|nr:DNA internalization-related competence protein ComEC/Rec2 [Geobacter sp. OR-1]GAM09377.1 ComE operon protein 3 [Geobacter sp. OR-1]